MTHLWDELEGVSLAGEYALEKWLGNDGSGAFFLTTIGAEGRQAVIKLVADEAAGENQLAWWQTTARLAHPNLLALLDCGRTETANGVYLYAVFDYPDDNVASALERGPLSEPEAREVLAAVVDGLRYIHNQGLVHTAVDVQHIVAVGDRIQLSTETLRECIYEDARTDDVRALGPLISELLTTRAREAGAVVELSGIGEPLGTIVRDLATPERAKRWTLDEIANALNPQNPPAVTVGIAPAAAALTPNGSAPKPRAVAPAQRERSLALPLLVPAVAAVVVAVALAVTHRSPVEPAAQPRVTQAAQRVALPDEPKPRPAGPPIDEAVVPARTQVTRPAKQITQAADYLSPPAEPKRAALASDAVTPGPWRVIAYTFTAYKDALKKAKTINDKFPGLGAEVFTPKGRSGGPFLVAIGGRRTRADAVALLQKVREQGLPRDTYIQNYSN